MSVLSGEMLRGQHTVLEDNRAIQLEARRLGVLVLLRVTHRDCGVSRARVLSGAAVRNMSRGG